MKNNTFLTSNVIYFLCFGIIILALYFYWPDPICIFWGIFSIFLVIIWHCNVKGTLLKDTSIANKKPYSYARVQLAWWTLIIMTSFVSIYIVSGHIPTFNQSNLVLLGIGVGTTAVASAIDVTDRTKGTILSQDFQGSNLLLDILSDKNGISLSRLQTVIFNITIGIWYIQQVVIKLSPLNDALGDCEKKFKSLKEILGCYMPHLDKLDIDHIMPLITPNNLILLGVSAGTYAALKTNENAPSPNDKIPTVSVQLIPDNSLDPATIAAIKNPGASTPAVTMKESTTANTINMQQSATSKTDFSALNAAPGNYIITATWQMTIGGNTVKLGGNLTQSIDSKTTYPLKIILTKQP